MHERTLSFQSTIGYEYDEMVFFSTGLAKQTKTALFFRFVGGW